MTISKEGKGPQVKMASTLVDQVPPIARDEAKALAATENERILSLLQSLRSEDWGKPTDCPAWDVRAMASHVLGAMEAFATIPEFIHQMRAGTKAAGDGPLVDGMTAVQVSERAHLPPEELVQRIEKVGPRVVRARHRVPASCAGCP